MKVLAIDCGGTFIKTAVVGEDGKILESDSLATDASRNLNRLLDDFESLIERHRSEIRGVGIAFAGPVDSETGLVLDPPNFPREWRNFPLSETLRKRAKLPVFLENDANLAALGEYWLGAGQGVDVLVVITMGTGIGGGIVLNGQIWSGATGIAGEVGHIEIAENGPLCGCGSHGCLEVLASSTAVLRMAEEFKKNGGTKLAEVEKLTAKAVFEIASAGDSVARSIFVKVGDSMGRGIAIIAHVLGPRRVVLTGGGAGAWELFRDPMVKAFQARAFEKEKGIEIVRATLGEQSGILGAARFAMQRLQRASV